MNKQDTAANRAWIEAQCTAETTDANRALVLAAIDARFPGARNDRCRDDLIALFDTMLDEDFDRVMLEDAKRNAPSLCECI
jgi:hypothetical protein